MISVVRKTNCRPSFMWRGPTARGPSSLVRAILGRRTEGPLLTSPHLVRFHERIVLAGLQIEINLESCSTMRTVNAPSHFFEIITAAAFLAFSENRRTWSFWKRGWRRLMRPMW